jgi:hypothetical protein
MPQLRGALPLLLTGSTGLSLIGFGLTGLSGMDPELRRAATTIQQERRDAEPPAVVHRFVDCPPDERRRGSEA